MQITIRQVSFYLFKTPFQLISSLMKICDILNEKKTYLLEYKTSPLSSHQLITTHHTCKYYIYFPYLHEYLNRQICALLSPAVNNNCINIRIHLGDLIWTLTTPLSIGRWILRLLALFCIWTKNVIYLIDLRLLNYILWKVAFEKDYSWCLSMQTRFTLFTQLVLNNNTCENIKVISIADIF